MRKLLELEFIAREKKDMSSECKSCNLKLCPKDCYEQQIQKIQEYANSLFQPFGMY